MTELNFSELVISVNKVLMLSSGLVAVATVPDDLCESLNSIGSDDLDFELLTDPGNVVLRVGCLYIPLPNEVIESLAVSPNIWVYLAGDNDYIMKLWAKVSLSVSELWAAKGIADYREKSEKAAPQIVPGE